MKLLIFKTYISPLQGTHLWLEERADVLRDKRMEEQEGLKRKLRRLEANLRRMQVARAETVARKRAEDNRMKEGKSST